jgi:integration host factor subunit alpha
MSKGDAMANKATLTRAEISEALYEGIGLSRTECYEIVDTLIGTMADAFVRGEDVKISGFGTFQIRDKNARIGRNPKTGVEVPIEARKVVTFRASQKMRDRIMAAG